MNPKLIAKPEEMSPGEDVSGCILLQKGLSAAEVISVALSTGFRHVVQESQFTNVEVQTASKIMFEREVFMEDPIAASFLTPQAFSFTRKFKATSQKDELLTDLKKYLSSIPGSASVAEQVLRAADEFFLNAVLDAPVIGNSTRVIHPEQETSRIFAGFDSDSLIIGCSDPYGSLNPNSLLQRVLFCFQHSGIPSMQLAFGGAGIGIYTVFESCISLIGVVDAGRQTVVCARYPLRMSTSDGQNIAKNLHFSHNLRKAIRGEKMGQLNFQVKDEASGKVVYLSGSINEDAVFTNVEIGTQPVTIDVGEVTALNSCGIREWIRWLQSIPAAKDFRFRNCPKVFVDQMNMVDGFLPRGAKVESFRVPYFCEACDEITPVLFTTDQLPASPPPCAQCGKNMELDVMPARYFKFFKNQNS